MNFVEGELLLFDKPYRWTSFDLVNKVRWMVSHFCDIDKIKVGHTGTLDPLATGLVLVCTGRKTKEIDAFSMLDKEYVATMQLGATTPSFDIETAIDANFPTAHLTRNLILTTLDNFLGSQMQEPPAYSAVKIEGKRAYSLARKGMDIHPRKKEISLYELELLKYDTSVQQLTLRMRCSKGTYVRAFVRDFCQAMHTGGHLIGLRRTKIGDFSVEDSMTITQFEEGLKNLITD